MTENEFVFCIGYDGANAIVDKYFLISNKNKNVEELFQSGFYRAAFSKALYLSNVNNDSYFIDYIVKEYNKINGSTNINKDDLKLLFGVFYPDSIEKIKVIYI